MNCAILIGVTLLQIVRVCGGCVELGNICLLTSECCSGICTWGFHCEGSELVKAKASLPLENATSTCLPNIEQCQINTDCCSGFCLKVAVTDHTGVCLSKLSQEPSAYTDSLYQPQVTSDSHQLYTDYPLPAQNTDYSYITELHIEPNQNTNYSSDYGSGLNGNPAQNTDYSVDAEIPLDRVDDYQSVNVIAPQVDENLNETAFLDGTRDPIKNLGFTDDVNPYSGNQLDSIDSTDELIKPRAEENLNETAKVKIDKIEEVMELEVKTTEYPTSDTNIPVVDQISEIPKVVTNTHLRITKDGIPLNTTKDAPEENQTDNSPKIDTNLNVMNLDQNKADSNPSSINEPMDLVDEPPVRLITETKDLNADVPVTENILIESPKLDTIPNGPLMDGSISDMSQDILLPLNEKNGSSPSKSDDLNLKVDSFEEILKRLQNISNENVEELQNII